MEKARQAKNLYFHLILLIAPRYSGKTQILNELKARTGFPLFNVSLEFARRMLDLNQRQRLLSAPHLLNEIISEVGGDTILLDNLEILFETALKLDPLRLLQGISRNHLIIASWNGEVKDGCLVYAEPGHPEYRKYLIQDFIVISISSTDI